MINLVDGDLLAYRSAASCEPTKNKPLLEPEEIAIWRLHDMVQTIIQGTNCNECEFYIGGQDNFRKVIYPSYKANRTRPAPTWLNTTRELLVTEYKAKIVNNIETDDMLGIRQSFYDGQSRIVSLDKDLLQIPGNHFQWAIQGMSVHGKLWQKPAMFHLVSPLDGLKTFYKQLIAGDGTDNIPSFDGKLRNTIPKFIEALQAPLDVMTEESAMYEYVKEVYQKTEGFSLDVLHLNAQLLYILKEEHKYWEPPT